MVNVENIAQRKEEVATTVEIRDIKYVDTI